MAGLPLQQALDSQVLIREDYDDWPLWLAAAGLERVNPARRLRFYDYLMALAAAIGGQGLLLGYSGYVDAELAAGLLVQPFEPWVPTGKGYYLVYRKERLSDPRVRAFRDWLREEAAGPPPA